MKSSIMWPDPDTTQALLREVGKGEPDAVNRLLARHRDALRRMVALRIDPAIAHRVDASDVVQETLLEAARRLPEYLKNPAMPFHLWIRHLARDHVIGEYRKHRLAQRRSVDREHSLGQHGFCDRSSMDLASQLVAKGLTPAADAIRKELQRRFHCALEQLDEHDREILIMRHFEHLSNQDIAKSLGLTGAAASMRYLRALRRIRGMLAEEDVVEKESP